MPQAELKEQPVAWQPDEETRKRARLTEFLNQIKVNDFESGYKKSIEDPEWFTEQVIKFLDIRFDPKPERTLDTSEGPEFAKWLIGAGLNISTACLDRWIEKGFGKNTAILWEGEEGDVFSLSYENLLGEAVRLAGILRNSEVKKGDAVGIFMPMVPETVIALMAIARIGAIAVPVFSGYGAEAITARMQAVKAKALIIADGTFRRGKWVDMLERAAEAVKASQSIQSVIISPRIATASDEKKLKALQSQISEFFKGYKTEIYSVLGIEIEKDKAALDEGTPLLEKTLAEDPLIILYTSGTTGRPKGIAHTHSSFPIKAAQDMAFGTDVGQGTKICWYTDIGWMMGPWLIYGALINGAVVCLFDGAPDYPELDRIWQFAARHEVEALGISPTLIRAQASVDSDGVKVKRNDLSKLRILASTGEPWNPDPWWWLFNNIGKGKIPIINYSGGTEISGGILMNNPLLPIKPCGFSAPCLGIDADILDENGKTVSEGEVGELVIKKPWIGMARGFWNEPERYLATYWSRFPKIWVHGDWALRDGDGHWFILGRSDDTIKVAGKRVGPAEIESILVSHPSVSEAAVIGIPDQIKGSSLIAFCVLTRDDAGQDTGTDREASNEKDLIELVARLQGKPLAPKRVFFIGNLPKTRNAKVMRRVIRAAFLGENPGDLSSLENPNSIDEIRQIGEKYLQAES